MYYTALYNTADNVPLIRNTILYDNEHINHHINYSDENYVKLFHEKENNSIEIYDRYLSDEICDNIFSHLPSPKIKIDSNREADYWGLFIFALELGCKFPKKYSKKILYFIYSEYLDVFFNKLSIKSRLDSLINELNLVIGNYSNYFSEKEYDIFNFVERYSNEINHSQELCNNYDKLFFPQIYKLIKNKENYKECLNHLFSYDWQYSLKLYTHNLLSININYYDININKYIYLYL